MGIHSAPYFWLVCDNCEGRADYGDYTAWAEADMAVVTALDSDWTTDGDRYHCPSCPTLTTCHRCGKPTGADAGDRDDHCILCWLEDVSGCPPVDMNDSHPLPEGQIWVWMGGANPPHWEIRGTGAVFEREPVERDEPA